MTRRLITASVLALAVLAPSAQAQGQGEATATGSGGAAATVDRRGTEAAIVTCGKVAMPLTRPSPRRAFSV